MDRAAEEHRSQRDDFHCMTESLRCKLHTIQQKDKMLTADLQQVKVREEQLKVKQDRFEETLSLMVQINQIQENEVKLDVGGQKYVTSKVTLTSDPDSLLAAMFSGVHPIKCEEDGSYFIDRDGTYFRYILNYLREVNGLISLHHEANDSSGATSVSLPSNNESPYSMDMNVSLPTDTSQLSELLNEAEYYRLQGLSGLIRSKLAAQGVVIQTEETALTGDQSQNTTGSDQGTSKKRLRRLYEKGQSVSSDPIL